MNHAADPILPTGPNPPAPASAPPPILPPAPPVIGNPPPTSGGNSSSGRKLAAFLLSLFLGLFLADGAVSLLDDSCVLLLGNHGLTLPRELLAGLTCLMSVLMYALTGLTPIMPKRVILPPMLFLLSTVLLSLPATIYCYYLLQPIDWAMACAQLVLGLTIIFWQQGGFKMRWPLVAEKTMGTRTFSWLNLSVFLIANIFVALPSVVAYVGGCAGLAASHFTDGFVSLRPSGIVMQARKYIRDDGKTVLLFPMSHVAELDFYQNVMQAMGTNSIVLLEGVTDTNNLLTHRLSYQRAANFFHLAEQHYSFSTNGAKAFRADVDISNFSSNTIALLNIVTLVHSEGVNAHTISMLMGYTPSEQVQQQLFDDLLVNRNQHVLEVLRTRLPDSDSFIIPWGAAHMAGIAREIQKSGFHLVATRNFVSIRFIGKASGGGSADWIQHPENSR